ncbi:MAG: hypothetical protein ABIH77_03685 [Pseudomonadota bacterium]|nr:hypothetical protein [Gammaproteobacteria bacterium]MBU1559203.1 hypothetical protein [Gammaproteobacteria bacterium]MBU1629038.1 hypothetical protein [Gammaproteobacteria bacterium]MBU1926828.1 hypothetical protein [Gammaproteobacteria bacterium]MBU2546184.1 hypothetical protein [Gammaproteobacteria bacterium]
MKRAVFTTIFCMFLSGYAFAGMCPTPQQVDQDFKRGTLKVHQYVNVRHQHMVWEAMMDHKASDLGISFDYVQIDHDAPYHEGVSCFYSSNHGNDITFVYRFVGDFKPGTTRWKETVSGGPMCGDYHKTIKNPSLCAFKKDTPNHVHKKTYPVTRP